MCDRLDRRRRPAEVTVVILVTIAVSSTGRGQIAHVGYSSGTIRVLPQVAVLGAMSFRCAPLLNTRPGKFCSRSRRTAFRRSSSSASAGHTACATIPGARPFACWGAGRERTVPFNVRGRHGRRRSPDAALVALLPARSAEARLVDALHEEALLSRVIAVARYPSSALVVLRSGERHRLPTATPRRRNRVPSHGPAR